MGRRPPSYYYTAEPVGECSCHTCTCPGCHECDPDYERPEPKS